MNASVIEEEGKNQDRFLMIRSVRAEKKKKKTDPNRTEPVNRAESVVFLGSK